MNKCSIKDKKGYIISLILFKTIHFSDIFIIAFSIRLTPSLVVTCIIYYIDLNSINSNARATLQMSVICSCVHIKKIIIEKGRYRPIGNFIDEGLVVYKVFNYYTPCITNKSWRAYTYVCIIIYYI